MKLIIQIPCLNEEQTLPDTLKDLPKSLKEVDVIETLVIDDGSTDHTVEAAKNHGAHHILRLTNNKGLAKAFYFGLNQALKLDADIIVNTDADNQYDSSNIQDLINPILSKNSDIVIGARDFNKIRTFSKTTVEANADSTKKVVETGIPPRVSKTRIKGAAA